MSGKKLHPFTRFAQEVARRAGHPVSFAVAIGFLVGWLVFGPLLDYHPAWLNVFGITTGVFTFLMVFLIQNTQNRDTEALHLKLDELLRVTKGARKDLIDSEDLEEEELDAIKKEYDHIAEEARHQQSARRSSKRSPRSRADRTDDLPE